jgi:3'-phosphoadenosine 5'-phosphosulfate sulfotransferase (PAPS reductase)/FAD synthetase
MTGATKPLLRVLSLGAGVQSTTLALMAAAGEIEAPDCAIFADTGWEPKAVYQHLDRLERCLPFPVHRVSKGNLRDDVIAKARGEGMCGV